MPRFLPRIFLPIVLLVLCACGDVHPERVQVDGGAREQRVDRDRDPAVRRADSDVPRVLQDDPVAVTTSTLSVADGWRAGGAAGRSIAKYAAGVAQLSERASRARSQVQVLPPAAPSVNSLTPSATGCCAPCDGDLPPCAVAQRESGGDYGAFNPNGCGGHACYGKWQFSGAWAGKLGLPLDIASATPAQQDAAARALWAGGAGCSHWAAC
jgi:hypothetical protein